MKFTAAQRDGQMRNSSARQLTFTEPTGWHISVLIAWLSEDKRWACAVIGPFTSKAEARAYGREHYPRRHIVAGVWGLQRKEASDA